MCFCDPQSSCQFSDGDVSFHRGKERTERERQRQREAPVAIYKTFIVLSARGSQRLPSPQHLSLISDKALFKCLLFWPIHDWRWHLRNTSKERRGIGRVDGEGGSARSILVGSIAINMFLLRRSCQHGDSPLLRLISQRVKGVSLWVDELNGWSPFVMRTTER